jgi:hypothetical protein
MRKRLLFFALLGLLSVAVSTSSSLVQTASAAPQVGPLRFSEAINDRFEPQGEAVYFSGDNNGVYVTFEFRDLPPGSNLNRIVRLNGDDYNFDNEVFGHLSCCPQGGSGRYGFLIVERSGDRGDLPGGAYEVVIYNGGQEVARGGFGIRGEGGGDNDNESNDND